MLPLLSWTPLLPHPPFPRDVLPLCHRSLHHLFPDDGLKGMLVNLAAAMRYGWWGTLTNASEAPLGCNVEAWLLWSGVGGFFACAFLRVYRYHNVLVLHDGRMCPLPLQLATLLLPFLVPPAFFTGHTGAVAFDQDTQECERQPNKSETFAFGIMVVMASATVALACSLRRTKLQVTVLPPMT